MSNSKIIERQETKDKIFKAELIRLFKDNKNFKSISIKIYSDNLSVFLCRTKEKNVCVEYEYDYINVFKNDKYKTMITGIPVEIIKNIDMKILDSDKKYLFEFMTDKINYHLIIELM